MTLRASARSIVQYPNTTRWSCPFCDFIICNKFRTVSKKMKMAFANRMCRWVVSLHKWVGSTTSLRHIGLILLALFRAKALFKKEKKKRKKQKEKKKKKKNKKK